MLRSPASSRSPAVSRLRLRPSRRAREMELKVTTLEGKEAGSVQLSDAIFGLEPRADIIQRCVQWQLNKRQAGTHKTQGRADVWRTGKKMYKQKGTGGARHGSARVPQFRGGGRAFGPVVRSHATDLPKKVRALALKHALSAKAKDGGLIVIDAPVVTEKATVASEHNKVVFRVASKATKPQIKEAVEKLFDVKVKRVNTLVRKGKTKVFRGNFGSQSDVKRAVVTLEEGHRIDVTTGLKGDTAMALKTYNPTTPGQRQLVMVDRSALYKGKPVKALTEGKRGTVGRNNTGRITVRFRGGGHKKSYRLVDFKRNKVDVPAVVERLEYDPNRTAFIALIKYQDGEQAYILAPQRLAAGDTVVAGNYVDVKPGNVMPLGNMPVGTIIHNIEMKIGKGGQIARSAGTYAQIVGRDQDYVILRLNSGE